MTMFNTCFVCVIATLACLQTAQVAGQGLQIEQWVSPLESKASALRKPQPAGNVNHVGSKADSSIQDDQSLPWRLPREVLPTEYSVRIAPNIDAGQETAVGEQWFTPGDVNITVQAQIDTKNIVLHSKNTTIHSMKVRQGAYEIPVLGFAPGPYDFLNISLGEALERGHTYTISITFTSYITEDLNGLYRSSYINPDNNQRVWLATTQMEALHARQMMPCFDEPALKSVFRFTIGHMDKYLALFNTESQGTSPGPTGWVWETFAPTVKQSTYLLALIISHFTFAEAQGSLLPNKKIRTYAPDHYIRDGAGIYAADQAEKVIHYFGNYFNQEYPLNKMDSAAVPDFFFGAMENYGLNIYRESALLVFPNVSLESERWSISSVIAHELAHQWFGNLVSPAFWTHIWLNEGFATYFANVGAQYTNPEYEPKTRFLTDSVQRSMEAAADPNQAHSVKIDEQQWITKNSMDWFDRMAYDQAGSLIRMMDGFLTTPVLTGGLKFYLDKYKYAAAQQDFLFDTLTSVAEIGGKLPANLTVKDIMDTWTLKAGFPLVRVSRASSNRVYVSQEKFVNNAGGLVSAGNFLNDELWHIPISVATKASANFDPQPEFWLDKNVAMTSVEVNADEWLLLNAGVTGFYRVLYDTPLITLIRAQLETDPSVIDPLSRSQLQDDYFTSAYQKYISLSAALELTVYLRSETEIIVWNSVLKHLRKPLNLFGSSGSFAAFRDYLLPRIKSALNATGGVRATFPERAGMPVLRHQQLLDWACALMDEECRNYAVELVTEWDRSGVNGIPRDIQDIVYCHAVSQGAYSVFEFIEGRFNDSTTTAVQRARLLSALTCTRDVLSAQRLLSKTLITGYYKNTAEAASVLTKLATSPLGRPVTLRFIREQAADIKAVLGTAPIGTVFTTAGSYVNTVAELEDLQTTATEISAEVPDQVERMNTALRTVEGNIAWMGDFGETFINFFGSRV